MLREPVQRCASEYQYRVRNGGLTQPFEQWIQTEIAQDRMTQMLAGKPDADAAIEMLERRVGFVGLVERFDESLIMWRRWLGDAQLDIRYRSKNVAADNSIKRRLLNDPVSRARLEEANRLDLKLYEYVVSSVYPRQVQQYGPTLAEDIEQFTASNQRPNPYPRQLPSLVLRKMIYRPLALKLAGVHRDAKRARAAA
jgi:hypothetical protein